MRVKIRISLPGDNCLFCGKHMGFLRSRRGNTLCEEHEQEILADLRALALARLDGPVEEPVEEEAIVV